jgi:hypothetical protein
MVTSPRGLATQTSAAPSSRSLSSRAGPGDADERRAVLPFAVEQGVGRGVAEVELAVKHARLAGAARPVGAGVGQPHAVAQAGVEHGLVLAARNLGAERLHGDGVRSHVSLPVSP